MLRKMKLKTLISVIIFFMIIVIMNSISYAKYMFDYTKQAVDIEIISENLTETEEI